MISALAITYNEEANIERFVKSMSFADEIIIVDSNSTDKTVEIAKTHHVKVIKRKFDDFASQKNFAIKQANFDWIVFFDLDEEVSAELTQEIKSKIAESNNIVAYKLKRIFFFMGKKIRYSGYQNDRVFRVFKKSACQFNSNLVHETLAVEGATGEFKNSCNHYSYKTFDLYNKKLSQYSKLQAQMLYKKNVRPNLYHFLIRPFWRFFHQYLIKRGILDGKEGFILAYLSAFAVFKRYIYLWLSYRNIE